MATDRDDADDTAEREVPDEATVSDDGVAGTERERAVSTDEGTGTGLDENVAGALSYLLGPVTGVLFYLLEEDDEFVRFHAAQSTVVFGGLFVLTVLVTFATTFFAFIPIVGWLIALVLGLGIFLLTPFGVVLWVFLMYKAYSGEEYELPFAGGYARKYAPADADPTGTAN